eukprot:CAMPEP_0119564856 /NCGR_PEP_ID=MMETSP1352-20130426/28208_1 /TAXON_ID=265584 /ORGANISM="Stauroneis constricta, Strain CCMP1120" /LENGTH=543 /DNA_ID=CAMNT_0007613661 /DNA_START=81 /DNA_END=1712 /DNA_ORIENTATION=-
MKKGAAIMDFLSSIDPKVAALVVGGSFTAIFVTKTALQQWGKSAYEAIKDSPRTQCDIDSFVGEVANPPGAFKVAAAHRFRLGWRKARTEVIPIECTKSPHFEGLHVARNVTKDGEKATPLTELLPKGGESKPTVVVATIRMGFGHHRLAYSACSWALAKGYTTIFHDMLNIQSEEADLIKSVDELYSKFSRLASEMGGPVEKMWGSAMKAGDADALRIAAQTAAHLQPLLLAYPKDIPIITTHQLVALTAAAIGFTNVVNLVVDNYPQWFLVVPRTLNLCQGPVNYQSFLRMGVPADELAHAGHWIGHDMVSNIPADCKRRADRAKLGYGSSTSSQAARRLLIPVGGAGAQRKFIIGLIAKLETLIKNGRVQLLLNAGDHAHMKTAFIDVLDECKLDYDTITTTQGVYDFQKKLLASATTEPAKAVTLFAFDEYFPAVATTDILGRVADVLTCKPSELAFYPVPKLHIRRVGDHEADSARRSAELGDGSLEARELEDAMANIDLFLKSPDWLVHMNESIIQNNTIGVYDGCKKAVEFAVKKE